MIFLPNHTEVKTGHVFSSVKASFSISVKSQRCACPLLRFRHKKTLGFGQKHIMVWLQKKLFACIRNMSNFRFVSLVCYRYEPNEWVLPETADSLNRLRRETLLLWSGQETSRFPCCEIRETEKSTPSTRICLFMLYLESSVVIGFCTVRARGGWQYMQTK